MRNVDKFHDGWITDLGFADFRELLKFLTPPSTAPVNPRQANIRGAFENAGYNVLWFVWEERPQATICEIGLESITAPWFQDEPHLLEHLREILHQAQTDVKSENIVASLDFDDPHHLDVGFVIIDGLSQLGSVPT